MKKKKLLIISNDKIYHKKYYFTSNNDLNTILVSFKNKIETYLIARKSNQRLDFILHGKKKKNIFFEDLFTLKNLNDNYKILMISVTPFNFFILFYLKYILRLNFTGFVYLRSDGYKEYETKYGLIGYFVYNFFFKFITANLKIISCSSNFRNVEKYIRVFPTELNAFWTKKRKRPNLKKPNLLFIGRYRIEKGIFSILDLLKNIKLNYSFTYVGYKKNFKFNEKTSFKKETTSMRKLKSYYDLSNIFILPSFTEGYPKVISESVARLRPVIIFDEIKHLKKNFYGVFSCERNSKSLKKKIKFIIKNYFKIQRRMIKNKLYTKKKFQQRMLSIIND